MGEQGRLLNAAGEQKAAGGLSLWSGWDCRVCVNYFGSSAPQWKEKRSSIISRVSLGAGSNFHSLTASFAEEISTGLPPTASDDFTEPFGATTATSFTTPETLTLRARSGYTGATLWMTWRPAAGSLVESCAATTETATNAPARSAISQRMEKEHLPPV